MAYQDTIAATTTEHSLPRVREITPRDMPHALAKGIDDFRAMPTHVMFLSLILPAGGSDHRAGELRLRPTAAALSDGGGFRTDRPGRSDRHL